MPDLNQQNSRWGALKNWVISLTGVLVAVPALIYSGIDIYKAVQKIPRTDAEKSNVALFEKYFGQSPVTIVPVPVQHGVDTYEVKFSIYEGGDVYIEYGEMTQWFPFPSEAVAFSGFELISSAVAADQVAQFGSYEQQDEAREGVLIRKKSYSDGTVEQQTIDTRSGKILEVERTQEVQSRVSDSAALPEIGLFATIDLNAPVLPEGADKATLCRTPIGACKLLRAVAKGAPCSCTSSKGLSEGTTE